MEVITVTTKIVFDVAGNAVERVYPGDDPLAVIQDRFGMRRGDVFKFGEMTVTKEVRKVRVAGSDNILEDAAYPVGEPAFRFVKTWKWTGKQFKEIEV